MMRDYCSEMSSVIKPCSINVKTEVDGSTKEQGSTTIALETSINGHYYLIVDDGLSGEKLKVLFVVDICYKVHYVTNIIKVQIWKIPRSINSFYCL